MAKPPETPPHSDTDGVNMDARPGRADKTHPDPGGALERADAESSGHPHEGTTPDSTADEGQ